VAVLLAALWPVASGGAASGPMAPWATSTARTAGPDAASLAGAGATAGQGVDSPRDAHASPGLMVVISLPSGRVDAWAEFTVSAIVVGGFPGPMAYRWSDTLGVPGASKTLTLSAPRPGPVGVGVEVWDGLGDSATANATITVGEGPSVAVGSSMPSTDVGLAVPVSINVSGGVPPYRIDWQALPGGAVDAATLTSSSGLQGVLVGSEPGLLWVRANVTDAEGVSSSVEAVVAVVHPLPTLFVSAVSQDVDAGELAVVTGLIGGGTPPFHWTAVANVPAVNVTGAVGSASASQPAEWSGRFVGPGNATVEVQVLDAAGVPVSSNTTLRVFRPLVAVLAVESFAPAAGAPLNLSVDAYGGVPPYTYAIRLSDGEGDSGTLAASGTWSWIAHPTTSGFLLVQLSVQDVILANATETTTVALGPEVGGSGAPPSSGLPDTSTPPTAGASTGISGSDSVLAVAGGGALALLFALGAWTVWRRRRAGGSAPPGGAAGDAQVVRRLVEESGGTVRSTLQLLAEEEGIGPQRLDAALAYWRAEGRLHVDTDPEGGETLRWNPSAPSGAPAAAAAPADRAPGGA